MEDIYSRKKYLECIENVSKRLEVLENTIVTMYVGLENEQIQKQALDSIECIGFCIECIRMRLDEELQQNT